MGAEFLTRRGGHGEPLVLVHGLMGRGTTWSRQLPWLTRHGEVYTYDAPWHRGRDVADPYPISTERFVDDLGDAVATLGRPADPHRPLDGRPALLVPRGVEARPGDGPRRRGHGAGLPRPHHRPVGAVAARPSGRIRFGPTGLRRVRAGGRASTSSRLSTAPRPVGGCTGTPRSGSTSPRSGARATTGHSGATCGCPHCSSRRATPSRRRDRCGK